MLYILFTSFENMTFSHFHGFTYASPAASKNLPPVAFKLLIHGLAPGAEDIGVFIFHCCYNNLLQI